MRSVEALMRVSIASLILGGCARVEPKNGDKSAALPGVIASEVFVPMSTQTTWVMAEIPTQTETTVPQETEVVNGFLLDETKLVNSAKAYLADTMQESIEVARAINWFPKDLNEHPSNMCGPLSGQLLIDAGIIGPLSGDELKKTFWYAKADRDKNLLLATFPEDQFDWKFVESAFGTYDFGSDSLEPGDWIYLTANKGGSFEHMLTVTRVERDADGNIVAAFSVNNVYVGLSADGEKLYQIIESKLYDTRTGEHYEYGYPNYKFNASTGSTFVIVRRKDTVYSGNP
jgi:hypothetical protein